MYIKYFYNQQLNGFHSLKQRTCINIMSINHESVFKEVSKIIINCVAHAYDT